MGQDNKPPYSYRNLTEFTERQITRYRDMASQPGQADPVSWANHCRTRAHGAFDLWDEVSSGWQMNKDRERLKAMVLDVGCVTLAATDASLND